MQIPMMVKVHPGIYSDPNFFEVTTECLLLSSWGIRGVKNLIIYSLPERKEFYPEIVNMLDGADNMACTVLFSFLDNLRLERIVGTAPAKRMVAAEKGVFVFCH